VASLNHPHVLRVFDWGEDTDGPYLVLEYLGGGSLRDLLDRGVRLSHSQAAAIGTEVAQGLAYAHARGLVHRDIKPANLLFDEEGRVRVADFGVARALAEAAWTEPQGAMVGTARYMSPEAAEGRPVDGRADVYSLAIVLYEAVTGTVPFVTDTTMGTLAARIGQPLPHHSDLGPLDEVLRRAAAPDVATRLDAAGLAARLGALSSALPTPAPLPLVMNHGGATAPINGFRAPGVAELTEVAAITAAGTTAAAADAGAAMTAAGTAAAGTTGVIAAPDVGSSATATVAAAAPVGTRAGPGEIFDAEPHGAGPRTPPPSRKAKRSHRRAWIIAAVVLVALLIAGGLAAAFNAKAFTPSHPVPALTGLSLEAAQSAASKVHMNVHASGTRVHSITVATGDVVAQNPTAGTSQKEGSTVTVVLSSGLPSVSVPSLSGMTCAQATTTLEAAHFKAVCAPPRYDNTTPAGQLVVWSIGSTANPTSAPYGSTITLVPSQGHSPVTVPAIPSNFTFSEAQAALQAVGLSASQNPQSNSTVPAGNVIDTSPPSGTAAPYGSTVTVNVSTGAPTTQVPNVLNQNVAQATAHMVQAGLTVSGVSGPPNKPVVGTQPAIGATVKVGSAVQLFTQ
jgi:serine/threonine-protein kinase